MPQITVHVVFDTSSIKAGSADYLLSAPASKLIKSFSQRTSPTVRWYLRPMVRSEREYQMVEEALPLVAASRKAARLMGTSFDVPDEQARAQVERIIQKQIADHGIRELDFDEKQVDWANLLKRAVQRQPPFEKGDSEKGFRDAIILETFLQLHQKLNVLAPDQLVLLSGDLLLKRAAEQALNKNPEVLLIDSIPKLETHLVALATQIDQNEAEQMVLEASRFFADTQNLGNVTRMVFSQLNKELEVGPPEGGVIGRWHLYPGETALVNRQRSLWEFETTVLIEVEGTRILSSVPSIYSEMPPLNAASSEVRLYGASGGKGSTNIVPVSASSSSSGSFSYIVSDRLIKSIGRHAAIVEWSATQGANSKLTDFQVRNIRYEGVVWKILPA
jgi:hypothetical protein